MCTLAVWRGVSPLYPLIVVANRDEFLGRASSAPTVRPGDVLCGLDLVAGGTWLGCRTDGSGRIVGMLNRRPSADRPASGPGERSRGLLCMEMLTAPSIDEALAAVDDEEARRYGGFNLFVADLDGAAVLDNGSGLRRADLPEGLSVLTNLDVNDPRCPRLAGASRRFEALSALLSSAADTQALVPALASVLSSHEDGGEVEDEVAVARFGREAAGRFAKVCVHVEDYGTRSSSMIFVEASGRVRYFHAEGAPCRADFVEVPAREDSSPEADLPPDRLSTRTRPRR
jgi:uncharacterized protein with NRDE domain